MRILSATLAAAFALGATSALAASDAEFNKHCAWGLSQGKKVMTDCANSITDNATGKTYCFSNNQVKWQFMSNFDSNVKKAKETFGRS